MERKSYRITGISPRTGKRHVVTQVTETGNSDDVMAAMRRARANGWTDIELEVAKPIAAVAKGNAAPVPGGVEGAADGTLHGMLSDVADHIDYEAKVVERAADRLPADDPVAKLAGKQAAKMADAAEAVAEASAAAADTTAEVFNETGVAQHDQKDGAAGEIAEQVTGGNPMSNNNPADHATKGNPVRIIGYTWEADIHSVPETFEKFGPEPPEGYEAAGITDFEGNPPHPIFSTDELEPGEYERLTEGNPTGYDWHRSAQTYLARLGAAEYDAFLNGGGKQGQYVPSEYMRDLIEALGDDDENEFKGLIRLRGSDSALGEDFVKHVTGGNPVSEAYEAGHERCKQYAGLDPENVPDPLSGEFAGESMPELLGENYTDEDADDYEEGYWDAVTGNPVEWKDSAQKAAVGLLQVTDNPVWISAALNQLEESDLYRVSTIVAIEDAVMDYYRKHAPYYLKQFRELRGLSPVVEGNPVSAETLIPEAGADSTILAEPGLPAAGPDVAPTPAHWYTRPLFGKGR